MNTQSRHPLAQLYGILRIVLVLLTKLFYCTRVIGHKTIYGQQRN